MEALIRPIVTGVAVGGIAASLYLAFSNMPPALADEQPMATLMMSANEFAPTHRIDPEGLVRIGDEAWSVTADPGVSLEPIRSSSVRKIGYGVVSTVQVSITASGTYSSDAITDPHIRYPGIHVERVYPDTADGADANQLAYWTPDHGWLPSPPLTAGSFVLIAPFKGGLVMRSPRGNCVLLDGIAAC